MFGENLWIKPSDEGSDDAANRWTMYSLDIIGQEQREADQSLMIVPSVPKIHEGEALEEVALSRDEMANMAWGIETRVPLPSGGSTPGREAARDTVNYLRRLTGGAPAEPVLPRANLRYRLMSSVPENWIPFISTHVDGDKRKTRLQRGAMPRIIEEDTSPTENIRPRSNLLRTGLNREPRESYFLNEEEIPRAGVVVRQSFQRTRWYNGQVCTWQARRPRRIRQSAEI